MAARDYPHGADVVVRPWGRPNALDIRIRTPMNPFAGAVML